MGTWALHWWWPHSGCWSMMHALFFLHFLRIVLGQAPPQAWGHTTSHGLGLASNFLVSVRARKLAVVTLWDLFWGAWHADKQSEWNIHKHTYARTFPNPPAAVNFHTQLQNAQQSLEMWCFYIIPAAKFRLTEFLEHDLDHQDSSWFFASH